MRELRADGVAEQCSADYPVHIMAGKWSEYYKAYAKHFNLYENIIFNVSVISIKRDKEQGKWLVQLEGEAEPRVFDKVVVASGTETAPKLPQIMGLDQFQGTFIHGQAFKR
jgi:dimethylaniline monooxygenase (N-oxide forming)